MDGCLPIVSGNTIPGNSTVLRTGTIGRISGGNDDLCSPSPLTCSVPSAMIFAFGFSALLCQAQIQAAVFQLRPANFEGRGREPDTAFEPAVGYFEPADR